MALKKDYIETKPGLSGELFCANSYWRVEQVSFSKKEALATVNAYIEAGGTLLVSRVFSFAPIIDDINAIAQAYEYLKTLPEFEGAEDC
jgi:hypothetical protein